MTTEIKLEANEWSFFFKVLMLASYLHSMVDVNDLLAKMKSHTLSYTLSAYQLEPSRLYVYSRINLDKTLT